MFSGNRHEKNSYEQGRPFPEALCGNLGKNWKIVRCRRGMGYVDFTNRSLVIPFDPDALSQNIRRHELAHIAWTKRLPLELAQLYHANVSTIQVVEDSRIQFLLRHRAGLNLDAGFLEPPTVITGIQALLSRNDYKEVTRHLVASGFSGTESVIRECLQAGPVAAQHPDAVHCLRLASNAHLEIACDPSEATMGKVARWLDNQFRILGWDQPATSKPKAGGQKPRRRRDRGERPESSLSGPSFAEGDDTPASGELAAPGDPRQEPQAELWSSLATEAALSKFAGKRLPRSIARSYIKIALSSESELDELTREQLEDLMELHPDFLQSLLEAQHGQQTKPHFPLSERDHEPWGTLEIQYAPLTIRAGQGLIKRRRATEFGGQLRYPHRLFIDEKFQSRDLRINGGVVCVDLSGSMGWRHDQFYEFLKVAPGTTIGIYAGEGDRGILKIVAANGWIAPESECKLPFALNIVDLPVLRWAAVQNSRGIRGPIIWLSDGRVTACFEAVTAKNRDEVQQFITANRIIRVETAEEAVKLLKQQGS